MAYLGGGDVIKNSVKHVGSCLSVLLAFFFMTSVLLPGDLIAEEISMLSPDTALSAAEVAGVPVNMADELFGVTRLADAAEKYHPANADSERHGNVSFIVAGEVRNPGEYSLSAPINLLSALLAAGGPTPAGNMRQVQVFLDGNLLGEFDLYGFLHEGRIVDDFVFNGGEHVMVLPHGPRVCVSGHVTAPAIYELLPEEMNLQRLLQICGGFAGGRRSHRVEIIRIEGSSRNIVFSKDVRTGKKIPSFALQAGDRVNVYENVGNQPGIAFVQLPDGSSREFSLRRLTRVSQMLEELQPLPTHIALSYAELLREGRPDKKYEVIGISLEALSRMIELGDTSHDLILRPGDRLMLFDREFIEKKPVVGMALKGQMPIFTDFRPGMKISDLFQATDFELKGKPARASINRRSLSGVRLESTSLLVDLSAVRRGDCRHDIELQAFDILVIQP